MAKRFMVALVKGSRAMQGEQVPRPGQPQGLPANMSPPPKRPSGRAKPQIFDPDLKVYIDSIKNMEEVFRWAGWTNYTTVIPQDKMADSSFEENAVKVLGPFKP